MLDEPFGALDVFTREDLWVVLQEVCRIARRPTVILVTHDLREAVYLADRVLVMSARPGRIVAERAVPFPRPRGLDGTYATEFEALVHELRDQHQCRPRRGRGCRVTPRAQWRARRRAGAAMADAARRRRRLEACCPGW